MRGAARARAAAFLAIALAAGTATPAPGVRAASALTPPAAAFRSAGAPDARRAGAASVRAADPAAGPPPRIPGAAPIATQAAGERDPRRGGALDALAAALAAQAATLAPPTTTRLALQIEAPAPRLAAAATQALARALREAGFAPPLPAADPAAAAADARIDLRVGLRGDRLVAAGALQALRPNFFTGAALSQGGALAATAAADEPARLLAADGSAIAIEIVPFARLPVAPLALAIGPLDGETFVAALTEDAIHLFDPEGRLRSRTTLPPAAVDAPPSRDPRGGVAIAGDRLRWAIPSRGRAGLLRRDGDRLVELLALAPDLVPLAADGDRIIAAPFSPATHLFEPRLLLAAGASPAAPRALDAGAPFVAALADRAGALAVIDAAGTFRPLGGGAITGVGDAAALADLDGDGMAELVATAPTPAPPDAIRVLAVADGAELGAIGPLPHLFLAAAAGDLGAGEEAVVLGAADGSLHLVRRAR